MRVSVRVRVRVSAIMYAHAPGMALLARSTYCMDHTRGMMHAKST